MLFNFVEASEKGLLRGLQELPTSPLLEVYISEVSIQKGAVKPFDKDGCPSNTGGPSVTNYYAVVKYMIHNSGDADFSPPSAYKGEAACHKPAIFDFLYLEGLIPSVKLSKFATCVVDDELAGEDACAASSIADGMTIRYAKSYGRTKAVSAKFKIDGKDFATLFNSAATTQLDLKLSVNSLISPAAVSAQVSVLKGSSLGSADWLNPAVIPKPVVLYSAPTSTPTLTPTTSPTDAPTFAPTLTPTTSPTGAPTFAPTLTPIASPTDAPTLTPTASPTGAPRFAPSITPITFPTIAPTIAAYYVVIDKVVDSSHDINLAEVQLFNNGIQISRDQLTFTLNGQYNNYPASLCNDGNIYNFCNSAHSDPALTIVSTMPFDKVVVYNRNECCQHRIVGATITVGINGQLKATTFPSATAVYTFAVYPSALQLV